MKQRMLTAVVVLVTSIAILAGCGSSSKAPSTGNPGTDAPTTVTLATTAGGGGGYGY